MLHHCRTASHVLMEIATERPEAVTVPNHCQSILETNPRSHQKKRRQDNSVRLMSILRLEPKFWLRGVDLDEHDLHDARKLENRAIREYRGPFVQQFIRSLKVVHDHDALSKDRDGANGP